MSLFFSSGERLFLTVSANERKAAPTEPGGK